MLETSTAVAASGQILAAIFRATRSAKRYRDAASACYEAGAHLIDAVATQGPLTVYRGGGYCFHSLLRPSGIDLESISDQPLLVEAKPAGRHEMKLRDAKALLRELVADEEGFDRLSFPSRERHRGLSPAWSRPYDCFGDDEFAEECYGLDDDMDNGDEDDNWW